MKQLIYLLTAALLGAMFVGCETTNPYDQTVFRLEEGPRRNSGDAPRYGYRGQEEGKPKPKRRVKRSVGSSNTASNRGETKVLRTEPKKKPANEDKPDVADRGDDSNSSNDPVDELKEEKKKPVEDKKPTTTASDRPYASPVSGKYGHVISPFAPGREVDVTGFPPGTEVKCPYTQKIFRVP